ncbi:hypothetical protein ACIFOT_28125 [Neobacillus sp. NRS-1170]|uniref:hypothetical protein n=1 Tax=Neobacillus sp. NRS-1170 TaxID=3233898 RepID=UPI003D2BB400
MKEEEWLERVLDYLQGNLDYTLSDFRNNIPEINVNQPEGTYLVWVDCRELRFLGKKLNEFMLQNARVGMNQGYNFGKEGEGFMRLNIACPRSMLQNALSGMENAVASLCKVHLEYLIIIVFNYSRFKE